ncbi:Leucyl aminopeptidase yscIV [Coemansia spiralis]|uniref:Leucyl aminopeptidase yscIV n=2 Tax=Coemansia TaxID=4863 RepID=A0A9W8KZI7_9FUNG|nr:peptidase family M1-domain-containing protein [Coemansia spiralis]KAJ1996402.1 Leucyl aminopeptidase yscIV [Coemansia umbellata]KAJ2624134.1 Leucyl aminopeptidase yscIV [Coemansia sp. RSA 1358]KAJ2680830.1 Leucyl aminopeptidase yscIV [Coemansia spiralis]
MFEIDPNSQSNLNEVATLHVHLDLAVEFACSKLSGTAILELQALAQTQQVVLDTAHLTIKSASLISAEGASKALKIDMGTVHDLYGTALRIVLPGTMTKDSTFKIAIEYETTPKGGAIQFLVPEQTLGKKHPYLFTQCEEIHARSLFPCQDSPSVKISYSASIRVPKPLTALMSAIATGRHDDGGFSVFNFEQKTTIPSYLVALVVGNLATAKISDRCAVWSEPETIDACAWEFSEMERMLQTAEELITPYQWGRYDLLVLPPSFPFGGMENPCLTFVTPTLLAGDRSLTDVIAHEIAHSWSGNLVTAKNWEHFWLNEGWTTYFERKIVARLSGEDARQLSCVIGEADLIESVEFYGKDSPLTALVPKLDGVDPDDAYSTVPYDKGAHLLYYLEQYLGGPVVFEPYMRAYINEFQGKSIDTDDWKSYLFTYFGKVDPAKVELLDAIEWDKWLYAPGMPPVKNKYDEHPQKVSLDLASRWLKAADKSDYVQFKPKDIEEFSTMQRVIFLSQLAEHAPLKADTLDAIDDTYKLTGYQNCEVRFSWLSLALKSNYMAVVDAVIDMLSTQGRMKYTRPLYRLLHSCPDGRELAEKTFARLHGFYHPICARMVEKDLGL